MKKSPNDKNDYPKTRRASFSTSHMKRETWMIDGDPYRTNTIPKP
jgi:hypothetical protein